MTTILIKRTNEFANRLRAYGVYIDGKKVGTIANGETKEFHVPGGKHRIMCKIDWCSSPQVDFDATDDTIKMFKVGGFKNAGWLLPVAGGIVGLSFVAGIRNEHLLYILVPAFLVLVYFITIGRKRYLTLNEE